MKFEEYKEKIYEGIYGSPNNLSRSYELIEGVVNLTVAKDTFNMNIGGKVLPVIACVHKETGQTIFFNPYAFVPKGE